MEVIYNKYKTNVVLLYQKLDGQKLDKALKARNLTRQELADQIGVSRRSVQSWITGSVPKSEHLAKVCGSLKITEKELVKKKFRIIIYK